MHIYLYACIYILHISTILLSTYKARISVSYNEYVASVACHENVAKWRWTPDTRMRLVISLLLLHSLSHIVVMVMRWACIKFWNLLNLTFTQVKWLHTCLPVAYTIHLILYICVCVCVCVPFCFQNLHSRQSVSAAASCRRSPSPSVAADAFVLLLFNSVQLNSVELSSVRFSWTAKI